MAIQLDRPLYQDFHFGTLAKVEFHFGELFPRVGFIVTNLGGEEYTLESPSHLSFLHLLRPGDSRPREEARLIPLLLAGALVSTAIASLTVANRIQDYRLKGLELQQKQIELKLKEHELDSALQNPKLKEKAQEALGGFLAVQNFACIFNRLERHPQKR